MTSTNFFLDIYLIKTFWYYESMEPQHSESAYPATTREQEIGELFTFIKAGKSAQLIAMPGVGRANTLGFLAYNRAIRIHHTSEKDQVLYHFVVCNFSEMKNRPLFDVIKFIFLELTSSLHERRREEEFLLIDKIFKDALSYQDELVLFQALKDAVELLTLEKGLFVVFCFDQFESYIPWLTSGLFTNLRSLRSRAKYKFSVIFSTTRPLEDLLGQELLADFYEYIADNHVYLSLTDTVGQTFRIHYLEKLTGKKISQSTINSILAFTGGHGKLTRLSLEAIFAKEEKVSETLLLSLKTIQGTLGEIWNFLTPDEQQDILHICHDGSCPHPNPFLQKIFLLQQDKITIPLFQTFAKTIGTTTAKEPLVFDSLTNTIQQGGRIVSDQLTHSEFRLLRLLLEHQDTVVDRETIVQTIWSDTKTQAGVSEQAVDQLIFRLRKKIEEDPSSPTHIQTVKGRGLKFSQQFP